MNFIISAIILVELLLSPAYLFTNYLGEKTGPSRIGTAIIEDFSANTIVAEIESIDISKMLTDAVINQKEIGMLLENAAINHNNLHSTMKAKAHAKTEITDKQMSEFSNYMQDYSRYIAVADIETNEMKYKSRIQAIKIEIMKTDSDMDFVCNEFKDIIDYQLSAIKTLKSFVQQGENTLVQLAPTAA